MDTSRIYVAELFGTFLLVFFGVGAVHSAVLTGSLVGLWQVAVVWGLSIMFAIYSVGSVSGAHLNPAVSIAMVVFGKIRLRMVPAYVAGQLSGAFAAAAMLFFLFNPFLVAMETRHSVTRGEPGSIVTAMCFGEYFPNPGPLASSPGDFDFATLPDWHQQVTPWQAMIAEAIGTAILVIVIFSTTDPRNRGRPTDHFAPVFIGLTITALICVIAPLTQAGFNPARDFGPRLFAWLAGWGAVALPGQDGSSWFWVYIAAPIVGGLVGGAAWHFILVQRPDTTSV